MSPNLLARALLDQASLRFIHQIRQPKLQNLAFAVRKSHFCCFNHANTAGLKSILDIHNKNHLGIFADRFCQHVVNLKSSLGMQQHEILPYFTFLNQHELDFSANNSCVLNLYQNHKISLFSVQEVQNALKILVGVTQ